MGGFTITVQELKQKLDLGEKLTLIDVREPIGLLDAFNVSMVAFWRVVVIEDRRPFFTGPHESETILDACRAIRTGW